MNAKELHDLYAPLWELVPETRPEYLLCQHEGDEFDYITAEKFDWAIHHYTWEEVDENAALCRVAVLNVLLSKGLSIHGYTDGTVSVHEPLAGGEADYVFPGDFDLDHALVAAALAKAKAKG